MPASNVGFHFILSSWKSIVKALDVNCSSTEFVRKCTQSLSTPVYFIYHLHPAFTDMVFALQALVVKRERARSRSGGVVFSHEEIFVSYVHLSILTSRRLRGVHIKMRRKLHTFHLYLSFSLHSSPKSSCSISLICQHHLHSHSPKQDIILLTCMVYVKKITCEVSFKLSWLDWVSGKPVPYL